MHAKSLQSCLSLCSPIDCSPPGSSVRGILLARILQWVALPSSRRPSLPRDGTLTSYVSCIGRLVLCQEHHLGSSSRFISKDSLMTMVERVSPREADEKARLQWNALACMPSLSLGGNREKNRRQRGIWTEMRGCCESGGGCMHAGANRLRKMD